MPLQKNFESEQIYTFQNLSKDLLEFKRENLILGGDLNLYLNPRVDKLDPLLDNNDNLNYRNEILSFLETENRVDIWRVVNPFKKIFTWHRGKQKSRLDYYFTSDHFLNIATTVDIMPGIHSDHSLLKFSIINHTKHKTGKGFWIFNTSLLHDHEYVTNIKNIIKSTANTHDHIEDKNKSLI